MTSTFKRILSGTWETEQEGESLFQMENVLSSLVILWMCRFCKPNLLVQWVALSSHCTLHAYNLETTYLQILDLHVGQISIMLKCDTDWNKLVETVSCWVTMSLEAWNTLSSKSTGLSASFEAAGAGGLSRPICSQWIMTALLPVILWSFIETYQFLLFAHSCYITFSLILFLFDICILFKNI